MTVTALGDPVDITGPFPNNGIGVAQIVGTYSIPLADGNILHIWSNPVTLAGEPSTIFFTVTDTLGNTVIEPQRLTTDTLIPTTSTAGYEETLYGATVDASGNLTLYFHIFYGGNPYGGEPLAIDGNYVRSFDASGSPIDAEPVETSFGGLTFLLALAGTLQLSNGNLALADGRGLVIMDDSGTVLAGPNNVVLPPNTAPRMHSITETSQGIFVVSGNGTTLSPLSAPLTGQLYDLSGNAIGDPVEISAASGETWVVGSDIAVATLTNGNMVVAWNEARDDLGDTSGTGVYIRILAPDGTPISGPILVNQSFGSSDQYGPRVHPLADGGFAVTYQTINSDAPGANTYGHNTGVVQLFDASGALAGDPAVILERYENALNAVIGPDGNGLLTGTYGYGQPIFVSSTGSAAPGGGTSGNDNLSGNANANLIQGIAGNDVIRGFGGNDTIAGGDGNDRLLGGDGDDSMTGDAGRDRLTGDLGDDAMSGGTEQDTLLGLAGDDTLMGDDGDDVLRGGSDQDLEYGGDGNDIVIGGTGRDTLYGEAGDDTLRGNGGFDTVDGGDGDDLVAGGAQADLVLGGVGNDTVQGGGGFDTVNGGLGDDELTGNFNADRFVFTDWHGMTPSPISRPPTTPRRSTCPRGQRHHLSGRSEPGQCHVGRGHPGGRGCCHRHRWRQLDHADGGQPVRSRRQRLHLLKSLRLEAVHAVTRAASRH
ncbi:MAG: calcium-binding protein [Paracoccaceae bacterium]